jgi:Pyruvate/2-oxoacid:ferredoxin oxidoreductase delta subunit
MAKRNIVVIDEDKCNGCGLCVSACAEGAIQLVDGKAKLVSDTYCDGLGACLGECPQDAITIEQREAVDFDEEAAKEHIARMQETKQSFVQIDKACGCPGANARIIDRSMQNHKLPSGESVPSALTNWPVQINLVPVNAPYLQGADLLISADCAPFAFADFHTKLLPGKILLIGCPKLDNTNVYVEKLGQIFANSGVKSITIVRMEVPCCGGLTQIIKQALAISRANIPVTEVTVGISGDIIGERRQDTVLV